MDQEDDLLESLLAVAAEELEKIEDTTSISKNEENKLPEVKTPARIIKETDIFQSESNTASRTNTSKRDDLKSVVHSGDTDSSDDEGNRDYENQKYSEYGREIKRIINTTPCNNSNSISSSHYGIPKKRISTCTSEVKIQNNSANSTAIKMKKSIEPVKAHKDVFYDPIFGMRIVNPLISSATLIEKMQGRCAVKFSDLVRFVTTDYLKDKDWVICGVLVSKSPPKTSKNGSQFSIWTISDLKDDIKTVALFMFSGAHTDLWKTLIGTVIGVLNPNIMDRKEGSKDIASLNVDTSQRVMIFGQSKDFGLCKSMKKNGEKCTAIVNLSNCEFCLYHIKQEYQKCSKRSELQSSFVGKGLTNLRNKVLGKSEVFYAGKSYMAIPAQKSRKLQAKDSRIMEALTNGTQKEEKLKKQSTKISKKGMASQLVINPAQRARDLELLKKLGGTSDLESKSTFLGNRSSEVSLSDSKAIAIDVINKLKSKQNSNVSEEKSNSKYDLKGDLFRNVDNKTEFSEKMSNTVSLDQSKKAALDLATKSKKRPELTEKKIEDKVSFPDNFDEEFGDLNYGDFEEELTINKSITLNNEKARQSKEVSTKSLSESKKIASNTAKLSEMKEIPLKPNVNLENNSTKLNLKGVALNMGIPKLSLFEKNGVIDLNKPVTSRHVDRAKLNAIKFIEKNGPIKKIDPNSTKGPGIKKRPINTNDNEIVIGNPAKKSKLQESEFISDRFKKMMAQTSRHTELIEQHDEEEKEKYFNKQEAREKMEEKMANTHKVKCKAVKCLTCKYTSFSASDLCKTERHPLKVFDAMKRFYKCSNCQNRTVTLELVPTRPCTNCGSTKWEKTGMMKEKIVQVQHKLSVRGDEQKFVNSVSKEANLDLLVPDD
ncbi:protein MCM10 homolog [Sitophilus oryzae]|uniref:Protein MCM10 homolog n=1 Tax=Sitophilus oryzae TaxID=7048 RepID=A0A6J2XFG3_SITOR|nr:protein MCM10 homolog [Sitophilus oryzae]